MNKYNSLRDKLLKNKRPKLNSEEKELLLKYTSFLDDYEPTLSERYWYIRNNIKYLKICPVCGEKVPYNNHKCKVGEYCSRKCSDIDQKNRLEKQIKNNLKNYGVKYLIHTEENLEKSKKAIKEKYGVDNVMQVKEIKEKSYNSRKPNFNKIMEKSKETLFKNYGVSHPMQSEEIKNKMKENNIAKYGVDNVMKNKNIAKKLSKTNIKKSFDAPTAKWKKLIDKYSILLTSEENFYGGSGPLDDNGNKIYYKFKCKKCGNVFESYLDSSRNTYIKCPKCYPHQMTIIEELFNDILKRNYSGRVINYYRDTYEIDFYLPELNIGFEINGLYWHSEKHVDKNYHIDKFTYFLDKGIRIYNIFEDEILYKYSILENKIKHLLGLNKDLEKIYARNCYIKEIDSKTKNKFLNKYHIQGEDKSSVKLGLYTNKTNKLVSVMTFGIARKSLGHKGNEEGNIELIRFANSDKYIVLGSFGKLFKYFKDTYYYEKIITYADRRWSDGNLYLKNNFELVRISKPSYWYIKEHGNKGKRYHRYKFRKQKLIKEYPEYKDLTEKEIMEILGYTRIWDCGNLVFEFKNV